MSSSDPHVPSEMERSGNLFEGQSVHRRTGPKPWGPSSLQLSYAASPFSDMMLIIFVMVTASGIISHFVDGETEVRGGFTVTPGHKASEEQSQHLDHPSLSPAFQEGGRKDERKGRWAPEGKGAPAWGIWVWCLPKDENSCFQSLGIPQEDADLTNNGSALTTPTSSLNQEFGSPRM